MQIINGVRKKQPGRVVVAPGAKLLVSREEAAQLRSISQRGLDYLIANRRLPTRRIGGRVLIPWLTCASTLAAIILNALWCKYQGVP